jgi:anti-sigma B factor antagonist
MKLIGSISDSIAILQIEGSLSSENKPEFDKYINQLIPKELHLVLDLSKVSFIDSTTLGSILKFYSIFKKKKRHLVITNINEQIYDVFNLTGIAIQIKIFNSLQNAIGYIQNN